MSKETWLKLNIIGFIIGASSCFWWFKMFGWRSVICLILILWSNNLSQSKRTDKQNTTDKVQND